jgi:hypothetical protein
MTFATPLGEARLQLHTERKGVVTLNRIDVEGVRYASAVASVSIVRGRWRVYSHWLKQAGPGHQYNHACPSFVEAVRQALNDWWATHGLQAERRALLKQASELKGLIGEEERVLGKHQAELAELARRIALLPTPEDEIPLGTSALEALMAPALS